jgi:hypothetical protein
MLTLISLFLKFIILNYFLCKIRKCNVPNICLNNDLICKFEYSFNVVLILGGF